MASIDLPLKFRAMCPWCGCELPTPAEVAENEDWLWFERDPNDPDPIASFEEDMERKLGATVHDVILTDRNPQEFFNTLLCPNCGEPLEIAFVWKEERKKR